MERGASILARESVFHDTDSESGADAIVPVFSEAGLLFGCLVKFSGNQLNAVIGAFAGLSMLVSCVRYELYNYKRSCHSNSKLNQLYIPLF